jgi:hypothetical protein
MGVSVPKNDVCVKTARLLATMIAVINAHKTVTGCMNGRVEPHQIVQE